MGSYRFSLDKLGIHSRMTKEPFSIDVVSRVILTKNAKINLMRKPFIIKNNSFDADFVLRDYCQFSKESRSQIIKKINKSAILAADVWRKIVTSKTPEKIERFYASRDYIYDLLAAFYYAEKFNKINTCIDIVRFINKHKGQKVLEFGAGTGQLCLLLYFNTDKKIYYLDLPGNTLDFAKWRFKTYNAQIALIKGQINADNITHAPFDIIVSDAALEHVPSLAKTIKLLKKSLQKPGYLYVLFDASSNSKRPMHIAKIDKFYNILKKEGLVRTSKYIWTNDNSLKSQLKSKVFYAKRSISFLRKNLGILKNKLLP